MRTSIDRVRHTILFEVFGLIICTPIASWILVKSFMQVGTLSIIISMMAMCLNYIYNLLFDIVLIRMGRPVNVRPVAMRILHAVLFECSLLVLAVPFVAWWLDMPLLTALITDLGFALFFLVYAFVYNWIYDIVFPMPVGVPTC